MKIFLNSNSVEMGLKVVEMTKETVLMMLSWCPLKSHVTSYSLLSSRCVEHF